MTTHHRKPRSLGGTRSRKNTSRIREGLHRSWHMLFHNYPPTLIAHIINSVWLDPDWLFIPVRRQHLSSQSEEEMETFLAAGEEFEVRISIKKRPSLS